MQLDFLNHNRTPSYASMSTISGHDFTRALQQELDAFMVSEMVNIYAFYIGVGGVTNNSKT